MFKKVFKILFWIFFSDAIFKQKTQFCWSWWDSSGHWKFDGKSARPCACSIFSWGGSALFFGIFSWFFGLSNSALIYGKIAKISRFLQNLSSSTNFFWIFPFTVLKLLFYLRFFLLIYYSFSFSVDYFLF